MTSPTLLARASLPSGNAEGPRTATADRTGCRDRWRFASRCPRVRADARSPTRGCRATAARYFSIDLAAVLVLPVAERLGLGRAGVIVTYRLAWARGGSDSPNMRVPVDMPVAKAPDNDEANTR